MRIARNLLVGTVAAATIIVTSRPCSAAEQVAAATVAAPSISRQEPLGKLSLDNLTDEPLASFRAEQLERAFAAASAIPVDPHIKKRSKAQEDVVMACLRLGQVARAHRFMDGIDDWRRGYCYAELAAHLAERGATTHVPACLELAAEIADTTQEWRRDRVRSAIARVHAILGEHAEAAKFEIGVEASEGGRVAEAMAARADEATVDAQIAVLEAAVAADNLDLDVSRNVMDAYALLHDRFYADPVRRDALEAGIKSTWVPVPMFVRLEVLMVLCANAVRHDDRPNASRLLGEAREIMQLEWRFEDRIKYEARLAALRHRSGATEDARGEADATFALYEARSAEISDVFRAGTLRPLAEAYVAMGLRDRALVAYGKAVDEGAANPNIRPRAEDLSATLCSMAEHAFEPDEALWARIREIESGLLAR